MGLFGDVITEPLWLALLLSLGIPAAGYGLTGKLEGAAWALGLGAFGLLLAYDMGALGILLLMALPVALVLAGIYLLERVGPGRWGRLACLALGLGSAWFAFNPFV